MAIFSSSLVLRTLAVFHLTVAYFLLTSPSTIANQSMVLVLGASMQMPSVSSAFSTPDPSNALAALFLAFIGFTDLTAITSLPEEVYNYYWGVQAPARLLFLFGLTAWIYITKPAIGVVGSASRAGFGDALKNDLVFTFCFVEVAVYFWVYNLARDENRQTAIKAAERKKAQEDRL